MIRHSVADQICTVSIKSDIALHKVEELENYLRPLVNTPGIQSILLDCSEVTFIDSLGIGLLIALSEEISTHSNDLECPNGPFRISLYNLDSEIFGLFQVLGIDGLIDIFPDEAATSHKAHALSP